MQLSKKQSSKKILYMGFRATLNFRKFKVAEPLLKYKRLKLTLRVFSVGHIVAMVTYCVTKIIPTNDWAVFGYHDCSIDL